MFVRTPRLTLRPGWIEDAADLAHAIGHESVVRNLAMPPWPYPIEAAETFLSRFGDPADPSFLIFEHGEGAIRLIGGIGIGPFKNEPHQFGYWLTPNAWGRGYATEAGQAVLNAARARGIRRVTSSHFVDNPASARVLSKLGFHPTGRIEPVYSRGRGAQVQSARYVIDLNGEVSATPDPDARMAA